MRRASALAIVTLALGLGITSAMFSVVYGVLLRPLPFHAPDRVVRVWHRTATGERGNFAPGPYLDVGREARSLAGLAAYFSSPVGLAVTGEPVRTPAAEVSASFFDVLGATPTLGRTFSSTDAGGAALVVLGDGVWRRQFGADPGVLGRTVRVDGTPATVVGVMPPAFAFPDDTRLWRLASRSVPTPPLAVDGDLLAVRDLGYFDVVARLADGVSRREAAADLRVLAASLGDRYPGTDRDEGFDLEPVHEAVVGSARPSLLVLFGAVGAVLVVACTQPGKPAAGTRPRPPPGICGPGRARRAEGRIVRQLLVEHLLLALAGGVAGVLVSAWAVRGLVALLPASMPRTQDVRLDAVAVAFTLGLAILAGLGAGSAPAWLSSGTAGAEALRAGGRGASARQRLRRLLVTAQVATAVVLLAGAGVMARSVFNLQRVDVGFRSADVATQQIVLPQSRYDRAAQTRFYGAVVERLRADPRIRAASVVFPTPLVNNQAAATVHLDRARAGDPPDTKYRVRLGSVAAQYFATLGIPIVRGRDFAATDMADAGRAVIVNQALVRHLLGDGDPIGRLLQFGDTADDRYQIVGVAADAIAVALDQAAEPTAYLPYPQLTLPFMRVIAAGRGEAAATAAIIAGAVRAEAPDLPLDPPESLDRIVRSAAAEPRFRARLSGAFSLAALGLAALGLYALLSYLVSAGTRDFATRLALGASPAAVSRQVIGEGLRLTAAGLVVGLGAVLALGRLVDGLLFRTSTADPAILGGLSGVTLVVALAACYVPARRAMRIDPMTALRAD
ncbi:MAG: ABC transporter permease [Vicinamibacterales bacterium]